MFAIDDGHGPLVLIKKHPPNAALHNYFLLFMLEIFEYYKKTWILFYHFIKTIIKLYIPTLNAIWYMLLCEIENKITFKYIMTCINMYLFIYGQSGYIYIYFVIIKVNGMLICINPEVKHGKIIEGLLRYNELSKV